MQHRWQSCILKIDQRRWVREGNCCCERSGWKRSLDPWFQLRWRLDWRKSCNDQICQTCFIRPRNSVWSVDDWLFKVWSHWSRSLELLRKSDCEQYFSERRRAWLPWKGQIDLTIWSRCCCHGFWWNWLSYRNRPQGFNLQTSFRFACGKSWIPSRRHYLRSQHPDNCNWPPWTQ